MRMNFKRKNLLYFKNTPRPLFQIASSYIHTHTCIDIHSYMHTCTHICVDIHSDMQMHGSNGYHIHAFIHICMHSVAGFAKLTTLQRSVQVCTHNGTIAFARRSVQVCTYNGSMAFAVSGFAKPISIHQTHGARDCKYNSLPRIDFIIASLPDSPSPAPPERSWFARVS